MFLYLSNIYMYLYFTQVFLFGETLYFDPATFQIDSITFSKTSRSFLPNRKTWVKYRYIYMLLKYRNELHLLRYCPPLIKNEKKQRRAQKDKSTPFHIYPAKPNKKKDCSHPKFLFSCSKAQKNQNIINIYNLQIGK